MKILSQNKSKYIEFSSIIICLKGYIASIDEVKELKRYSPDAMHDIRIFTPWGKSFMMGTYANAERAQDVFTEIVKESFNESNHYQMPEA